MRDRFVNEDKRQELLDKMNDFIAKFDEDEGKENQVTFKAVASNLDWNNLDDVMGFAGHCEDKGIEGATEVIAFLYHQSAADQEMFEKIIEDMP